VSWPWSEVMRARLLGESSSWDVGPALRFIRDGDVAGGDDDDDDADMAGGAWGVRAVAVAVVRALSLSLSLLLLLSTGCGGCCFLGVVQPCFIRPR
jgi:hypothetical protein